MGWGMNMVAIWHAFINHVLYVHLGNMVSACIYLCVSFDISEENTTDSYIHLQSERKEKLLRSIDFF